MNTILFTNVFKVFTPKICSHICSEPEVKEYQLQLDQIENCYNRQSLTYSSSSSVTSAEQNGSSDLTLSVSTGDTTVSNCNNNNNTNNNIVSNNKISDNNSNHSTPPTTCRTSEYCCSQSDLYLTTHYFDY